MRPPVQIAVWPPRAEGAFVVDVGVQVSVEGSYRPPVLSPPPHTTMRPPVQIAVWPARSVGAFVKDVLLQLSVAGSYRLPVL